MGFKLIHHFTIRDDDDDDGVDLDGRGGGVPIPQWKVPILCSKIFHSRRNYLIFKYLMFQIIYILRKSYDFLNSYY